MTLEIIPAWQKIPLEHQSKFYSVYIACIACYKKIILKYHGFYIMKIRCNVKYTLHCFFTKNDISRKPIRVFEYTLNDTLNCVRSMYTSFITEVGQQYCAIVKNCFCPNTKENWLLWSILSLQYVYQKLSHRLYVQGDK